MLNEKIKKGEFIQTSKSVQVTQLNQVEDAGPKDSESADDLPINKLQFMTNLD